MRNTRGRALGGTVVVGAVACGALLMTAGSVAHAGTIASNPGTWSPVAANAKIVGNAAPNNLSAQLVERAVTQGSQALEGGTAALPFFGYNGNGPQVPAPGVLPSAASGIIEASKTEPDKNTYLVLRNQKGPDAAYDYGTHFLFQGHELGTQGYLTRINLDADAAHRVTLLGSSFSDGSTLPTWDGSTWDPFAKRLLLTAEGGARSGLAQATLGYPSSIEDLGGITGRGGFEGVQVDPAGNVWIVEDIGGATVPAKAKVPNSFIYRFVPTNRSDLTAGGRLQALQVTSNLTGSPITYQGVDPTHPTGNTFSPDLTDLHTYGRTFTTAWVTVHDSAVDGTAVYDANAAAKVAGATPFKRPENGVFRPGSNFTEFFFTETGDTNADSSANAGFGGWGGVFKYTQASLGADTGTLTIAFAGDKAHTGFDNITFLSNRYFAVVEDAGDTLHSQRNALDSGYVVDTRHDYMDGLAPVRFLGEGRDEAATLDSQLLGLPGQQNDGDNEITGIHASNGDASIEGLFGAQSPTLFDGRWRLFWTQQHGQNIVWEVTSAR